MARVPATEKNLDRVSTSLDADMHARFQTLADSRGMTLRSFMRRWVIWLDQLDPSEAAIVLDQIAREDAPTVAEAVLRRRKKAQREMDRLVEDAYQGPGSRVPHAGASAAGERVGNRPKTPAAG